MGDIGPISTRSDPLSEQESVAIEEQTLARVQEMIRAVDVKTPILMGIATGMLGGLAACIPASGTFGWVHFAWFVLAAAAPTASLILSALGTFPQTRAHRPSLLFFGTIAAMSAHGYREAIGRRSTSAYLDDLVAQVHRNAEIARTKYARVAQATLVLFVGVPVWVLALYLLVTK